MLSHHLVSEFIDGIYASAELEKSKQSGSIFPEIISQLKLDPGSILMVGDNKVSDYINAKKHGLNAYILPHKKYLIRNKLNNFGNDRRNLYASNKHPCGQAS